MKTLRSITSAMCVLALCGAVLAQTTINSSLSGRIADQSGAFIAGATLSLTDKETGKVITTTTDSTGFYTFLRLAPSTYMLTVERTGFKREVRDGVRLTVGEAATADITLVAGSLDESVMIDGGAAILQSQTAELSTLVNERRVRELPLNGKDFNKLVALAPGVAPTASSTGSPAVSGARTTANNYAIDGVASNDERVDGLPPGSGFNALGNAIPNIISTEALQEFRVITSNADATYGRGSGGQINVVTKSGTNRFAGSLYEYFRNDRLDARDFFNTGPFFNKDGSARTPPFRQNLYGATLGGPIQKERHFFFGSYEGFRQRREQTTPLTLPNADLIRLIPGDLGQLYRTFYLDGGIVPSSGNIGSFAPLTASARSAAIAAGFPAALFDANSANGEAGTLLISSTVQSDYKQNAFLIRTDHKLTDRLAANFRYGFADNEALGGVLSDRIVEPRRWQSPLAQFIYTVSSKQILEVRGALQRSANRTSGVEGLSENLRTIGVEPEQGIFISATNVNSIRFIRVRPGAFALNNSTTPQAASIHTLSRGRVTLRSGFELRRLILNLESSGARLPVYQFDGFVGAFGLLGTSPAQQQAIASVASSTVYGAQGGPTTPRRGFRSTQQEYFTQADWRVTSTVVLNLGLRYAYFSPYTEANNAFSNLYAVDGSGNIVPDASPQFLSGNRAYAVAPVAEGRPLYQPDRNNFEPRLGLAWDIGGFGKTVLRAGYGLYHDRIAPLEFSLIVDNPPFANSMQIAGLPFRLGAPLPVNPPSEPTTIYGIDPLTKNPLTHRFNVTVEQAIGKDTSISAAYVGARGRDLLRYNIPNGGASVPLARRPDPRFATIRYVNNSSSSDYNALQILGRHRFRHGIDLTVAYTFSRATDDVSAAFDFSGDGPSLLNLGANPNQSGVQGGGAQFVPRNVRADRGLSNFDVKHNLVISHLIDLPFGRGRRFLSNANRVINAIVGGYTLAGIAVWRSGNPFTVTLGRDADDDGVANDRPALLNGLLSSLYIPSNIGAERTQYLIPQAQAIAQLGVSPNVTDPFLAIPRNSFRAAPVRFYDVSFIKRISLTERFALSCELNAFNVFNQVNFAAPVSSLSDARFGRVTSTLGITNPRQLQLGMKLTF